MVHSKLPLIVVVAVAALAAASATAPEFLRGTAALKLFNALDTNRDHSVSEREFGALAAALEGAGSRHMDVRSSLSQVQPLWDANGNHALDLSEFAGMMRHLAGSLTRDASNKHSNPATPTQVHLMSNGSASVCVMWVTAQETTASIVQYGLAGGLNLHSTGVQYTYHAGDFENTTYGFHGFIHRVYIPLVEGSLSEQYTYRVGDGSTWSANSTFRLTANVMDKPTRLAMQGDMGTIIPAGYAVAQQILADHEELPLDLNFVVGDIAYAGINFPTDKDEFEFVWDLWGDIVQPLTSKVITPVVVGNHEKYYNFTSYRSRFQMPAELSGGRHNFWYSLDHGHFHITVFSTEHPYDVGTEQYKWIEQDLARANANRAERPWLIFTGHRPMYCTDTFAESSARVGAHLQRTLEPLIVKYNVDLMVAGHHHVYEADLPQIAGNITSSVANDPAPNVFVDPNGPVHVTQGTGGAFYPEGWQPDQPAWSRSRHIKYGYGRVTAYNATVLQYEFRPLKDSADADEFWIRRSKAPGVRG